MEVRTVGRRSVVFITPGERPRVLSAKAARELGLKLVQAADESLAKDRAREKQEGES